MMSTKQQNSYNTLTDFDIQGLARSDLLLMQQGVDEMIAVMEEAAETNYHILTSVLKSGEQDAFTQWQHYPPGDLHDREEGAVWFYHAHTEDKLARPWEEHGHFHLFVWSEHAEGSEPQALPPEPDKENGGLCHLVAVSFNNQALPTQIFTVNRWVAQEWQYPAETVISLLEKFKFDNPCKGKENFHLTSRWLAALLKSYRPQIEWALRERDRAIENLKEADPENWSEDEDMEVLSAVTFDFAGQIDALETALSQAAR